jgi:hypothetical protein
VRGWQGSFLTLASVASGRSAFLVTEFLVLVRTTFGYRFGSDNSIVSRQNSAGAADEVSAQRDHWVEQFVHRVFKERMLIALFSYTLIGGQKLERGVEFANGWRDLRR